MKKHLGIFIVSSLILTGCGKGDDTLNETKDSQTTVELVDEYRQQREEQSEALQQHYYNENPDAYERDQQQQLNKQKAQTPLFFIVKDDIGKIKDRPLFLKESDSPRFIGKYLNEGEVIFEEDLLSFVYYLLALVGESNESFIVFLQEYQDKVNVEREIQWFNDYSSELLASLDGLMKTQNALTNAGTSGQIITKEVNQAFYDVETLYLEYRSNVYAHIRGMTQQQTVTEGDIAPSGHLTPISKEAIQQILDESSTSN